MPTLLVALVYVQRAKPHLHIGLEQWALERVFLGALIVASKVCCGVFFLSALQLMLSDLPPQFLNDSTLKNIHWSMCTGIFGKRDIGRIEREYLDVLNFELRVSEDDVLSHHQGLTAAAHLPPSPRHSPKSAAMRLTQSSPQTAPVHVYAERRHAPHHHRRQHSPPRHMPELQPDSPASSLSSSSSSDSSSFAGPYTPQSIDTSPEPHPTSSKSNRKVLGIDPSQFQSRTIDHIIRRFPQIPRMHAWSLLCFFRTLFLI